MMDYSVTIVETSRDLSARERIKMKDFSNAVQLDIACDEDKVIIAPVAWTLLSVHNEHAKDGNTEYNKFIVIDKSGNKYVTGSATFHRSFMEIWDEMSEIGEDFEIEVFKLPSKNYKGKSFLTCSIL